jgi:hypothetical protein
MESPPSPDVRADFSSLLANIFHPPLDSLVLADATPPIRKYVRPLSLARE